MVRLGRLTLGALVTAVAACGASGARSSTVPAPVRPKRPPDCGPAQATTLAFSAQARVYARNGVVYGCAVPGGRSFRLGTQTVFRHTHLAGVYAVAGAVAGYAVVAFSVDTGGTNVLVERLSDGALVGSYPATNNFLGESFSSIGSLVVESDGAAAWIGKQTSIAPRGRVTQVLAASPSASLGTVLDSGSAINPASLRLHGSTLSWRHGGATRRATLR